MAINKDIKLSEMGTFLLGEVKEQVLYEIAPILHLGYSPGGYFGVTRQIVCMIDFLGALYCGFDPKKDIQVQKKRTVKYIASSKKALRFIDEIFGSIDRNYQESGKYLIEMYRHGLVHLYQPKELKLDDSKVLSWLPYKGGRTTDILVSENRIIKNASHLCIVANLGQHFLPVSIKCLYDDLLTAIDIYMGKLRSSKELRDRFISTANEIREPEEFSDNADLREVHGT